MNPPGILTIFVLQRAIQFYSSQFYERLDNQELISSTDIKTVSTKTFSDSKIKYFLISPAFLGTVNKYGV